MHTSRFLESVVTDYTSLKNYTDYNENRVRGCTKKHYVNKNDRSLHSRQKSGNNPTHLKNPYFKGFYSSRFAIDSNMTAKNQDALLFTAEHLLVLGTDLIIQSAEK